MEIINNQFQLIVNQALHGYKDGHTLLSSSIEIPNEAKRSMLILSDMSGQSMIKGFEEYLTGYPVKELNMYAIAKTWYAPEMKRPGCVWTHTLLINNSDLANLSSFYLLKKLFKRPTKNMELDADFNFYNKSISINEISESAELQFYNVSFESKLLKSILYSLYSNPNKAVFIPSNHTFVYEDFLISIWLQQWPRLRRNFLFCTGSISQRYSNNKIFDLQVISEENISKIRQNPNTKLLSIESATIEKVFPDWVNEAYSDLIKPSKLRNFLLLFGADVLESRDSYIPLVDSFLFFFQKSASLSETLEYLSQKYPDQKEANKLKMAIVGDDRKNNSFELSHFTEEEILLELSITDFYKSYDLNKLNLKRRIQIIYDENIDGTIEILNNLIGKEINPLGEEILKGVAEIISNDDLILLNEKYRKLLLIFVLYNPTIAYNKIFWEVSVEKQKENYSTLLKVNKDKELEWQNIINIILEIDAQIANDVFSNNQKNIVKYVLNWINNSNIDRLSYVWEKELQENSKEVLNWILMNEDINKNTLIFILSILNPNSIEVINFGMNIWENFIYVDKYSFNESDLLKLKSFLVALSFNIPNNRSLSVLSYSFEQVYQTVLTDSLNYNEWKFIEFHTKPLKFWNDWDKAKKLRKAIINKFIDYNWPISEFGEIFKYEYIILDFIYNLKYSEKNIPFIKELQNRLKNLSI